MSNTNNEFVTLLLSSDKVENLDNMNVLMSGDFGAVILPSLIVKGEIMILLARDLNMLNEQEIKQKLSSLHNTGKITLPVKKLVLTDKYHQFIKKYAEGMKEHNKKLLCGKNVTKLALKECGIEIQETELELSKDQFYVIHDRRMPPISAEFFRKVSKLLSVIEEDIPYICKINNINSLKNITEKQYVTSYLPSLAIKTKEFDLESYKKSLDILMSKVFDTIDEGLKKCDIGQNLLNEKLEAHIDKKIEKMSSEEKKQLMQDFKEIIDFTKKNIEEAQGTILKPIDGSGGYGYRSIIGSIFDDKQSENDISVKDFEDISSDDKKTEVVLVNILKNMCKSIMHQCKNDMSDLRNKIECGDICINFAIQEKVNLPDIMGDIRLSFIANTDGKLVPESAFRRTALDIEIKSGAANMSQGNVVPYPLFFATSVSEIVDLANKSNSADNFIKAFFELEKSKAKDIADLKKKGVLPDKVSGIISPTDRDRDLFQKAMRHIKDPDATVCNDDIEKAMLSAFYDFCRNSIPEIQEAAVNNDFVDPITNCSSNHNQGIDLVFNFDQIASKKQGKIILKPLCTENNIFNHMSASQATGFNLMGITAPNKENSLVYGQNFTKTAFSLALKQFKSQNVSSDKCPVIIDNSQKFNDFRDNVQKELKIRQLVQPDIAEGTRFSAL